MIIHSFSLLPFLAPDLPEITITGQFSFQNSLLALRYLLKGKVENISMPPTSEQPSRKDELWKSTCFEFFLAIKDQPGYWEFNLSPSGDWNAYSMEAYRRVGFREERAIEKLPFAFNKEADGHSLDVSVDVSSIVPAEQDVQMAITAIMQANDGKESYWALTHPAPHPDFHLREGFILARAARSHPAKQSAPGD
jgi:hypothetical protein